MAYQVTQIYGTDLAYVQQAGFGDFASRAAPGLIALLRRAGIRRGTVVDLGCGAGVWLAALSRAGYEPVGIEISPSLARIARRAAPRAKVEVGSIYERPIPRCDAVTALGEVLGYLPPGGARIPSFAAFFRRVARALPPGGVFAFDLVVRHAGRPLHTRTHRIGADWAVMAEAIEDRRRGRLERDITIFRRHRGRWRRTHELHCVRVPSREQIVRALADASFEHVRASRRWGAFALAPHRLAFVARRT